MIRFSLASALVLVLSTAAQADKIAGWEVSPKPDSDGVCQIQYDYVDKSDENAENSVVFSFGKDKDGKLILAIVFGYSRWDLTKGDQEVADLLVDDTVEFRAAKWQAASKKVMVGTFVGTDALLQPIAQGKTISLRFDKANTASFEMPNVGQAMGAAQICRGQIK